MPHLYGPPDLKRESRPVETERLPTICQLGGDNNPSSRLALRLQILSNRHGVPNRLAAILASMVWEGGDD